MRNALFAVGMLCTALTSTSAMAADPIADVGHDWSGPYIGLIAGYSWSDFDVSDSDPDTGLFDNSQTFGVDGSQFGAEIGWNHQIDSMVWGVAADIVYSTADGDSPNDVVNLDEIYVGDHDYFATFRGKLGYAMDNALLYVTGGLAVTEAEWGYENYTDDLSVLESASHTSDTLFGWTVGAGAELALNESISFKAEYLYADFGNLDYVNDAVGSTGDVDIDVHSVRVGVNWSF